MADDALDRARRIARDVQPARRRAWYDKIPSYPPRPDYPPEGPIRETVRDVASGLHPAERVLVLDQVEREVAAQVSDQNRKDKAMSVTGASYLAQTMRDRIAKAKARITASQDKISGALAQMDSASSSADAVASAIEKEAAELTAAAAALTNGPPDAA